ncbi:unnamed protein product [Nippostrongylus brasiliensis]|uniref:Unspecific monooxygenase n=1 Tax=Nippostrongylus brasiliensis TaxID=27835 RepID=A0A0N4YRH4_NIPBR|nr:unnamed protein product [Nippostrongylus brasiliensis]
MLEKSRFSNDIRIRTFENRRHSNIFDYSKFLGEHNYIQFPSDDSVLKYGPVFTLWLGPLPSVRIADYKLSQEAMVQRGTIYNDRWVPPPMNIGRGNQAGRTNSTFIVTFFDGRGLIFSNGALWQEQRRFSLHTLRNLGVSRNLVEERIMDEFNLRCDEIDQLPPNSSIEPTTFFDQLVGGVMNRMLFSVQPNEDDEKRFFDLKKKMDDMVERASVVDLFVKNWVLNVPIINTRWKNMFRPTLELKEFIREQIQTRKRAIDAGTHVIHSEPRDYVDAFIVKMLEHEKEDVDGNTFDDETLAVNVLDLWIAGQETTSTSLVWAVLYMLQNPQILGNLLLRYSIQPVGTMPSSNDVLNKFGIMKKSQHFKISLTKIV